MTTFLLARHGETDWNRDRRWQGHADRPLTERGHEQAKALARRLASFPLGAVYASDLRRAHDTAAYVAEAQDLPVQPMSDLREVDVGSWSGLTRADAEARYPEDFERWRLGEVGWRDGESYEVMSERVLGALREIESELPDGRVLIVTHAGPIRAIHAAALGIDVHTYRQLRPVEPNARLSAVCSADGALTELCPANELDALLARDRRERQAAAARPPSPAG